ncbi:hypothetical protein [Chitinimonas koreensis]|uniref:hypothetical protein n=1 Tax=Chitinimonas koreensis TaxID=356302 RepID=UPI0012F9939A|nr:hypothetical protein [Chitinimonas koreensis]
MQIAEQYQFIEAVEREFARKRASLLEDYKLLGRPVLIWQGAPIEKTFPNASLTIAKTAFDRGGGNPRETYWRGFATRYEVVEVFDGFASSKPNDEAGWVSELHCDGHLITSLWDFPKDARGGEGGALYDFHGEAFGHFITLAEAVYKSMDYAGDIFATCTLIAANELPLARKWGGSGNYIASSQVSMRPVLRWPVHQVNERTSWGDVGLSMSEQFSRLYA